MTNEALGIMRKDDAAWKILRNYKARFVKLIINIHKLQLLYFFWVKFDLKQLGSIHSLGLLYPEFTPRN